MAFLVFAISLIPGMFGARLGELDAYVPLSSSPGILSAGGAPEGGGLVWMKNQYREALDKARREAKRVLVSFTGYACTNCHWMKANMFTRPEIASALQDFVLVELYTDGTDAASEENQKLQLSKFSTIAIPFYAILDPDERVAAIFPSLTKDAAEYRAFLDSGKGQSPPPPTATVQAWAPFAGLSVNRLEGGVVDPATLQGKVVVLNFWATWCVPCIQEIPGFNRLHETLGNKGVAILGISMDEEGAPLIKKFVGDHPIQYPIGLGNESIANRLQVNELPVTLVFDRNGRQVTRFDGFVEEKKLLNAVSPLL
jgi:thiol:disulfide interchange protein DsbD